MYQRAPCSSRRGWSPAAFYRITSDSYVISITHMALVVVSRARSLANFWPARLLWLFVAGIVDESCKVTRGDG